MARIPTAQNPARKVTKKAWNTIGSLAAPARYPGFWKTGTAITRRARAMIPTRIIPGIQKAAREFPEDQYFFLRRCSGELMRLPLPAAVRAIRGVLLLTHWRCIR